MSEELMERAEALGINASLYWLLPEDEREKALKKDVEKDEKAAREEETHEK